MQCGWAHLELIYEGLTTFGMRCAAGSFRSAISPKF